MADFLKGLIKLAAAGVKALEGTPAGVQSHTKRAAELWRQTIRTQPDCFMGYDIGTLIDVAEGIYRNGWPAQPPLLIPTLETRMTNIPTKSTFEAAYAGQAPWDIGKPQKALVDVADQITGSILDAGCGTGDNALFFAGRGQKSATGIDFLEEPIRRAKGKAARAAGCWRRSWSWTLWLCQTSTNGSTTWLTAVFSTFSPMRTAAVTSRGWPSSSSRAAVCSCSAFPTKSRERQTTPEYLGRSCIATAFPC